MSTPQVTEPQLPPSAQEAGQGQPTVTQVDEGRPSWLPEKFQSPADLAKAYKELEQKLSAGTPATPAPETPPAPPVEVVEGLTIPDKPPELAPDNKIDTDAYVQKAIADGSLTAEDYAALEAAGVDRKMFDGYVAHSQAEVTKYYSTVKEAVGGEQSYAELVTWAGTNLNPDDISAFNEAVQSGNVGIAKLAVEGLKGRFVAANGSTPRLVQGSTSPNIGVKPFESSAQISAAMRDPRYKKGDAAYDPEFYAAVAARMAATNFSY